MAERLAYNVELDTRDALRKFRELGEGAEEGFEDAGTAAQELARLIKQQTDAMVAEVDATADAVLAMERALGDVDMDAREVVSELKRAGLSAQEVEADAEALADAMREVGRVEVRAAERGFDDVGQAVGGVRDETNRASDASRGFLGGMVGDSAAAVTGIGPLGEAISQMTEGIAEGEIGFKQLATAGLGMAAVALVFQQVTKAKAEMAAVKAFSEDEVDAYTESLLEAETVLDGVVAKLREAGEVQMVEIFGGDVKDVTRDMAGLGLTVDQFAALVEGGEAKVQAYADTMRDAGFAGDELDRVLMAAMQQSMLVAQSVDAAEASQKVFAETTEDASDAVGVNRDSLAQLRSTVDDYTDRLERSNDEVEREREAHEAAEQAIRDKQQAVMEAASGELAYEAAIDRTEDSLSALNEMTQDSAEEVEAYDDALRGMKGTMIAQAEAAVALAEDQARLNGETLTAEEKTAVYVEELRRLRDDLAPGSPLRQYLVGLIQDLNAIPAEKTTTIKVFRDDSGRSIGRAASHTGSTFGAGDTKDTLPGQVFVSGGGAFTAPADGRMLSQSESSRIGGRAVAPVNVYLNGDVYGTPDDEWVRGLAVMIDNMRSSVEL